MKKLILSLLFTSLNVFAGPEIMGPNDSKQIVATIKDLEVEDMLKKTSELQPCRKEYEGATDADRTAKLKAVEVCIKKQLSSGQNAKNLKELADKLNLQDYGLVKSKNVKDIQQYLTDKMIKTLTGVDPADRDKTKLLENLKFKNRKHVDQKMFIELYKTQLGKNALYEISRFCFEDLRIKSQSSANTFADHWKGYSSGKITALIKADDIDDLGEPKFGKFSDSSDKAAVYKDMFNSIQSTQALTSDELSKFFSDCGQAILPLCEKFEKSVDLTNTTSVVEQKATRSVGAAACLAKNRLQEYRKAISLSGEVMKQFEEMADDKKYNLLLKGEPVKIFGHSADDESIDDLTNNTSADIIEGGLSKNAATEQRVEECKNKPELATCEGFISSDETFTKAKESIELEMTLKREVEMARVRELVKADEKDLRKYLEDNGYMDILAKLDAKTLRLEDIEPMIGKAFEAKKIATIEQLNAKLGKRQAKKDQKDLVQKDVQEVIDENKEERARLAQVVLFNNIITSHLSLKKKDAKGSLEDAGRNVNAWKKEEGALAKSQVDSKLFENLKASSANVKGIGKDNKIEGFQIIDTFLGAAEDTKTGN